MVTVAVRAPVAAGVNVTVKAQLADAATGPPARGHGATPEPATAKSPGFEPARAMLVMLRVAVPLLVRVTVCAGLVGQTVTLTNSGTATLSITSIDRKSTRLNSSHVPTPNA